MMQGCEECDMTQDAIDEKKQDMENEITSETDEGQGRKEYLSMLSKKKFARIIAWVSLVIIGVLVVATFITGVTGSKYFSGCLFMCIIVPLLMYVFLWVGKVFYSK